MKRNFRSVCAYIPVNFANSIDPDEAAHNELLHPDLYCLHCGLRSLEEAFFSSFC